MILKLRHLLLVFICVFSACDAIKPTPSAKLVSTRIIPTSTARPRRTNFPTPTSIPTSVPPTLTIVPSDTPAPIASPITLVPVVIAIKPLPAGIAIPPEGVLQVMWPESAISAHALAETGLVINMVTLTDITCFAPLQTHLIARRTAGSGFLPLEGTCPPIGDSIPYTLVDIVITTTPLSRGMTIAPHDVALQPWPSAFLPPQAITALTDAIGTTMQIDMLPMQPLLQSSINPRDGNTP